MTQPAKAREPSMEEILASIRRIIADDDAAKSPPAAAEPAKPVAKAAAAPAKPAPVAASAAPSPATAPIAPASAAVNSQDDIDALFATFDATPAAEPPPPEPPPPPPAPAPAAPAADILELTEEMRTPAPPRPAFRKVEAKPDIVFNEEFEEPDPEPEPEREAPVFQTPAAREMHRPRLREEAPERSIERAGERPQLLSSTTKAAVDSAFNALAQTVLVQNARTLEDLVREMLRPMLKSWLDDNLPQMVERLVRAEIERVSRGRS